MAPQKPRYNAYPPSIRLLAAAILAPPVLAALYFGTPYVEILVLAAAAIMSWEWGRLCLGGRMGITAFVLGASIMLGVAAEIAGHPALSVWVIAAGAGLTALIAARQGGHWLWSSFGVAYIGLGCIAFLWLRHRPSDGRELVLWLIVVVWASDTAAYLVGKTVGGRKLMPAVSPNKTWSGLIGGVLGAALTAALVGRLLGLQSTLILLGEGAVIALVAQGGDLLESRLKRYFGAKDTSHLIPGHGGLLDRVDALISATLAVALVVRIVDLGSRAQ